MALNSHLKNNLNSQNLFIMEYKNVNTFEELLNLKYGEKGTPKRDEFHAKSKAFYLCEMLKQERKKANMTQTELAELADMKKEVISRIENGKVDVQLSTFLRLVDGLGLQLKLVSTNKDIALVSH